MKNGNGKVSWCIKQGEELQNEQKRGEKVTGKTGMVPQCMGITTTARNMKRNRRGPALQQTVPQGKNRECCAEQERCRMEQAWLHNTGTAPRYRNGAIWNMMPRRNGNVTKEQGCLQIRKNKGGGRRLMTKRKVIHCWCWWWGGGWKGVYWWWFEKLRTIVSLTFGGSSSSIVLGFLPTSPPAKSEIMTRLKS